MLSGVLLISQYKTAVEYAVGDVVKVEGFVNGQFGINLKNPEDPEFCAGPIVDGWRNAKATDPDAYYRIDPLTLDLDGLEAAVL